MIGVIMIQYAMDEEIMGPERKKYVNKPLITHEDYVEFEKECHLLTMEFSTPILNGRSLAGRRARFNRNMAKGRANRVLAADDGRIKRMICAALGEIKGELEGLVGSLLGIFAGAAILGMVITPSILAAIAIMIMKCGLAAFCAV